VLLTWLNGVVTALDLPAGHLALVDSKLEVAPILPTTNFREFWNNLQLIARISLATSGDPLFGPVRRTTVIEGRSVSLKSGQMLSGIAQVINVVAR
jgi:hypothetical protein